MVEAPRSPVCAGVDGHLLGWSRRSRPIGSSRSTAMDFADATRILKALKRGGVECVPVGSMEEANRYREEWEKGLRR